MKYYYFLLFMASFFASSQNYTSYFTGSQTDIITQPQGGICLMGGSVENDEAMKWFLQRASGGDILVLRASGSDGYNEYMYADLGITVNSVETIVCNDATASDEAYIQQKIAQAEGIWFAGGDQWDYVSYWRNTKIDSLINDALENRNIVIGGTSAGMAIQGKYYFSAENGSVTSAEALADPYNSYVTADSSAFIRNNFLQDVITDTHYDNPDRRGRHLVFLARILKDYGVNAKGIACEESTAVCIATDGIAHVYGEYPAYDEKAFFIQANCELPDMSPETCSAGTPLNWNRNGNALKVYKVNGTNAGTNTFNLNDWKTGNGGTWEHWSVNNGNLAVVSGTPIDCGALSVDKLELNRVEVYPNPAQDYVMLESEGEMLQVKLMDFQGNLVKLVSDVHSSTVELNIDELPTGVYVIKLEFAEGTVYRRVVKD